MIWLSTAAWFVQSPWMLFALFSLIVPIVIHLLSKSKGKLVPFANIKLIQLSKPVRMNEIRLVERLLLLCRLLLLFFSVMILAQLYYDDRSNIEIDRESNILITKDWLNHASKSELAQLSLKAKTGSVYLLSRQNKRLTSLEIFAWQENHELNNYEQQNTWVLVNNYVKTLSENVDVTVYSTNRLSQFIGDKVYLPSNVTWQIKKLLKDELAESLNELTNQTLSIFIINDETTIKETEYVNAALSIIKKTKLKNLTFTFQTYNLHHSDLVTTSEKNELLNKQLEIPEGVDWIFYLSSASMADAVLNDVKAGAKLITDISHSNDKTATRIVNWKEEVTQLQFPQMLLSLLLNESMEHYQAQQQITNDQIVSQLSKSIKANSQSFFKVKQFKDPLFEKLLILLLVLFWSIERVISEIRKTKQGVVTNSSKLPSNSQKIEQS